MMHTRSLWHIDGQYLASRLAKSITRESTKLKGLINKYNALALHSEKVSWQDVTNLSSPLWFHGVLQSDSHVPKNIKLDAIAAHRRILRSEEDIRLIKTEMANVVSFVLKDWATLVHHIHRLQTSECSPFNAGCLCLLQLARLKCEKKLCSLKKSFHSCTDLPEVPSKDFLTITALVANDGSELNSEWELLSVSAVDMDFCTESSDSDSEDGKFCYCSLIPKFHSQDFIAM